MQFRVSESISLHVENIVTLLLHKKIVFVLAVCHYSLSLNPTMVKDGLYAVGRFSGENSFSKIESSKSVFSIWVSENL